MYFQKRPSGRYNSFTIDLKFDNNKHATNKTGDRNELLAMAWLVQEGWEVYYNIGSYGIADIVAVMGYTLRMIDVKTALCRILKSDFRSVRIGVPKLNKKQLEMGVVPLYVVHPKLISFSLDEIKNILQKEVDDLLKEENVEDISELHLRSPKYPKRC